MLNDVLLFNSSAKHDDIVGAAKTLLSDLLDTLVFDAKWHPLGFIYVVHTFWGIPLRLHLWPPGRVPQDGDLLIHDHVFDFSSRVLLGSIENIVYNIDVDKNANRELYSVEYDAFRSILVPTGIKVRLIETGRVQVPQFALYEMKAGSFHRSFVAQDELICTVLATTPSAMGQPRVVGPVPSARLTFERGLADHSQVRDLMERVLIQLISE